MELRKVDPSVIKSRGGYTHGRDLQKLIEEFMNSPAEACEVIFSEKEYKNAYSCSASIKKAIGISRRRCRVMVRDRHVYMVKLDTTE